MPTRFKKTRKMRGDVSMGYGRVGKHRKHNSGRGMAGGQHHLRIWMDKYHPGHFGKVGQRHFGMRKNRIWCPTVKIDKLDSFVRDVTIPEGQAAVLNVVPLGFFKVLGRGRVTKPIIVKARSFSRIAELKIKKAGGACVLVA